jgi:NitT/TauT family transport system substrate-binding protein
MIGDLSLSRRRLLGGGAATFGALAAPRILRAADLKPVTMQLGWLVDANQAGEVAAKNLGYFAEEGLELTIQPGGPNIDGVAMVASGQVDIGHATSSPSLMLAASQGIPVKAFAVGAQRHPYAFFSLPANPVRTPQDMIGKKIGIQATGQVLLSALLKKNGIAESDVEVVVVGYDLMPLVSGQVDACAGWLIDVAYIKVLGPDYVSLQLWDAGVQLYADVYYATQDTLANRADLVTGFLRAAARGWQYAYEHPDETAAFLLTENPNLTVEEQADTLKALLKYQFNERTKEFGWGSFDPAVWQAQIQTYADLGQFTAAVPALDAVMTTAIVDATADVRPKLG